MADLGPSNFAANLQTARTVISQRLSVDPLNMTYDQRTQYNIALAQYITQYPNSFAPDTLDIARRILQQPAYSALQDTSLDLGQFVDDALQNANDLNPLNPTGLIGQWVVGIGLVVFALWLAGKAGIARHEMTKDE